MPTTTTDTSPLLASSGLGASLGQAIAFAMIRVGGMPFTSSQILNGQWDGTSLAGSLAMLDEAVDSGAWGATQMRAFLDTLDLNDFIRGSGTNLAALTEGLTRDPLLSVLAQSGLTAGFFSGTRIAPEALTSAADALTAWLSLPENHAPEATGLAPSSVTLAEGTGLTLHLADYFNDIDDDALTFSVTTAMGALPFQLTETGDLVLAPGFASSGFHGLMLTASDGETTTTLALDVNVTEAGAATRLMSMDFTRTLGQAETFAEALTLSARSRGIDILDQTALGSGSHTIAVDNLALRAAPGITGSFTLAETARVLTLRGQGDFTVTGNAGANVIYGGGGDETMYGGAANDQLYGEAGQDVLYGGTEADKLWGGAGQDSLYGGTGDDQLLGGEGDDYLRAGGGRDQAFGGAGADVFDFRLGDGQLQIRDMQAGTDLIRVEGLAGITSLAELQGAAVVQEIEGQVRLTIGTDQLVIHGYTNAQLTADMFLFA